MIEIVPSILTNDINEAKEMISRCEGVVERVSIDIIDGRFAGNKTISPDMLSEVETDLKIDYHLMVFEPVNWVEKCVRGQADRIIGQIEYMDDQIEFLGKVQELGVEVGLALDLETPVEKIDPSILTNLDVVLIMSVPAGFGGQKFDTKAIEKIKELNNIRRRDNSPYRIHDDGGITFDNIRKVAVAGVNEVSVGRLLFNGDIAENVRKFQEAAQENS